MSYRINEKCNTKNEGFKNKKNLTGGYTLKRGFVLLMAVMMLLSVITGCSGRNQAERVNENSSLQPDAGSGASSAVNGSVSDVPSADTDGSGAASDGSGGSGAVSDEAGGSGAVSDGPDGSQTFSDEPDASSEFPLTVTDANGDTMTLESPPQRIISLTLGSDEILFSLVDKSRIVSMTRYADDEGISNIAAEAKAGSQDMDMIENINQSHLTWSFWIRADVNYIKQLRIPGSPFMPSRTPNNMGDRRWSSRTGSLVGADGKGRR